MLVQNANSSQKFKFWSKIQILGPRSKIKIVRQKSKSRLKIQKSESWAKIKFFVKIEILVKNPNFGQK